MRKNPYLVRAVVHSALVLAAFDTDGEALTLSNVAARAGLSRTMTFRQLYTLERVGLIEKITKTLYRRRGRQLTRRLVTTELMELVQ